MPPQLRWFMRTTFIPAASPLRATPSMYCESDDPSSPCTTINVSGWNIRGRNIAADNLLNLQTPSGILADNTTRLWEVWYQQSFLDGEVDVKIGQQSLDLEFMTSEGAGLFLNSAMGWPVLPAVDQYAGGPA